MHPYRYLRIVSASALLCARRRLDGFRPDRCPRTRDRRDAGARRRDRGLDRRALDRRPQPAAGVLAIEMQDKDGLPGSPYTALLGVEVLSGAGDAVADATFDPVTLRTEVTFSSASGTVNSAFGPLVIVRYALDPALELDRRFILRVDPDALDLDAADGQPVPTSPRRGACGWTTSTPTSISRRRQTTRCRARRR